EVLLRVDNEHARKNIAALYKITGEGRQQVLEQRRLERLRDAQHRKQLGLRQWALELQLLQDAFYVPLHCNRLSSSRTWFEVAGHVPSTLPLEWAPAVEHAAATFGSRTAYCQGLVVPPRPNKGGALHNVFLCSLSLADLTSTFP